MLEQARELAAALPAEEIGCLYLRSGREPITPAPESPEFPSLLRHRGSVRGAWPVVSDA